MSDPGYDWADDPDVGLDQVLRRMDALEPVRIITRKRVFSMDISVGSPPVTGTPSPTVFTDEPYRARRPGLCLS
jgi:hypothetical protein